jgi:hypothetical protein
MDGTMMALIHAILAATDRPIAFIRRLEVQDRLRLRLIDLITENPGTPGGERKADTVSLLRADEPVLQISALSSRLVSPRSDGI